MPSIIISAFLFHAFLLMIEMTTLNSHDHNLSANGIIASNVKPGFAILLTRFFASV